MKKILSVLLCLVLLLGLWVVPANAAADVTFTITTDHQGVLLRGDVVTFVVTITGTVDVTNVGFNKPTFDTNVFEYVENDPATKYDEAIVSSVVDGNAMLNVADRTNGFAVLWMGGKTLPGTMELGKITLRVKDTAPFGDSKVTANGVSAQNGGTTYSSDLQDITVTIAECVGHVAGAWTKADENNHERTCTLCGGNKETAAHNWDMDNGVEKEPATCGAPGTKTVTCVDCGTKKDVEIPATGAHVDADGKWESNADQHFHTCACGAKFDYTNHTGGEATCKVQANCSVCGAAYGSLDANNHKNTEIRDAATPSCSEPGYTGDTWCKDCETKISTGTAIDPTGAHVDADGKWESNADQHFHTCGCGTKFDFANHTGGEATCKVQANCSVCGAAYGSLNATNHKNTEVRGAYNPSCNDPGYTGDTWCVDCNTKIATGTAIDPTGAHVDADDKWEANADQHFHTCGCGTKFDFTNHTAGAWTKVDNDTHKRNCTVCGLDEETAAHAWDAGTVTTPNNCGNDGVKTFNCECGATKTEVIPATGNHTAGAWTKVDNDTHKRVCSVCGKNEETAAHTWDAGVVTTPNDCGNDGVKTYTCSGCGATKTEKIPATGNHTAGAWVKVDNDTHKRTCSVCGKNEETAAHTWDAGVVTTPNDCGNDGVKTYTCADCGATKTEKIPATGNHNHSNTLGMVDEMNHGKLCLVCGEPKDTAPHTWDAGVVTTPNDCGNDGVKTYTCADCAGTKTEKIPATGAHTYGNWEKADADNHKHVCSVCNGVENAAHKWDEGKVTVEATETKVGEKTYTCADCGATKTEEIAKTTPVTADAVNPALFVVLMVLAFAGMAVVTVGKKKFHG